MQYGGVRWATAVKPSAGCSWKTHRKGLYWGNSYTDAEDEGIFDSGCSRSMTGNMERLDDFQEFQGGKVTFGGGEGRITGKGTIRTPTLDFEIGVQLEEERLGWEAAQRLQAQELADFEKQRAESLMKDANLARQMSQDFEMTEDQRKRQQEVLASAANYSDAAWDILLAHL
ncbi:hypothetical protein Tco_0834097 [Tanacetum coccineum]